MVPVFIVGIMGASLASCVLAVAAYSRDKLAYEGRGVSGDRSLYLLCLLHVTEPLLSEPLCPLHGYAATSSNLSGRVAMANASPVSLSPI